MNYPEKFILDHKYEGPQLLLLKGSIDVRDIVYEEILEEIATEVVPTKHGKPEISLHVLMRWLA